MRNDVNENTCKIYLSGKIEICYLRGQFSAIKEIVPPDARKRCLFRFVAVFKLSFFDAVNTTKFCCIGVEAETLKMEILGNLGTTVFILQQMNLDHKQ